MATNNPGEIPPILKDKCDPPTVITSVEMVLAPRKEARRRRRRQNHTVSLGVVTEAERWRACWIIICFVELVVRNFVKNI